MTLGWGSLTERKSTNNNRLIKWTMLKLGISLSRSSVSKGELANGKISATKPQKAHFLFKKKTKEKNEGIIFWVFQVFYKRNVVPLIPPPKYILSLFNLPIPQDYCWWEWVLSDRAEPDQVPHLYGWNKNRRTLSKHAN